MIVASTERGVGFSSAAAAGDGFLGGGGFNG